MTQMHTDHGLILGASKEGGTGWAVAETLAKNYRHLTVGARRRENLEKLARSLNNATAVTCDVTVEAEVEAMAAAAVKAAGPIDTAILVAGEGVRGNIDDIPESELQRALSLNLVGPVYFLRHMARRMDRGGSIVLMSSIAATNPWPGYFAYGSAKAGLQALVKYAALEYAPKGIRVNAVIPGPIETPTASATLSNPNLREAVFREIPLGRTARTQEVAETIAWFARSAPWITGECVHVDGGMHLRRPPFPDEMQAALRLPTETPRG
jgi:NAD(P)-dependent dehydrogenase (short-subunit alcohol dehydrogenase family)